MGRYSLIDRYRPYFPAGLITGYEFSHEIRLGFPQHNAEENRDTTGEKLSEKDRLRSPLNVIFFKILTR